MTLRWQFAQELCVWSYELLEAKPSPLLFASVLERLAEQGIAPGETLYVGNDCLNDIWSAQGAGCRAVLFAGDERSLRLREDDERCRDLHPDAVITELSQLLTVLAYCAG